MGDEVKISIQVSLRDFMRLSATCPKCGATAYAMTVHFRPPENVVGMIAAEYNCRRQEFVMLETGARGTNGLCIVKGNDELWKPGKAVLWHDDEPGT